MPQPLPNGPTTWDLSNPAMPIGAGAFMNMAQPAFDAMAEINGKIYENAAQLSTEWFAFLNRRLQEDFAVPQHLAACKNPQEAQQVWVDYWKTTFSQYQDEMERLAKMSQSCAEQTASTIEKHTKTLTKDAQLAA